MMESFLKDLIRWGHLAKPVVECQLFNHWWEVGFPPCYNFTTQITSNNSWLKLGKNLFGNIVCWGSRKQTQTTTLNLALFKRYGVPTGINDSVREVLTPTASQVSLYDTGMSSTSMPLHYIKESSRHLNSNHYNPMSNEEPLEKKPTLCLPSNLE